MRRVAVGLLLVPALAAAGCGSSAKPTRPAGSVSAGVAPSPTGRRGWPPERMEKVRQFLATATMTVTPSARSPLGKSGYRIGALFYHDSKGDHFCTASVVDSPHKDLLLTAAHCLHGGGDDGSYKSDVVFVPQYSSGAAPEGTWTVTSMTVDKRWISAADPDLDVGFATVASLGGKNIEDVLGGNTLGIDQGFNQIVQVTGYPSNSDTPISCLNKATRKSATQMRFSCSGFYDGTSGSPWISDFNFDTKVGTVVGVIGGYQEGGTHQNVSYSPYFDADVQALYNTAVAKG